ncbi:hypothetical protein P4361_05755 [Fictibacillus sp. B-59209]|uniref:hypothetical protein n=1 Tax=Fictibacillus sp. B-59209 TaxID=3024873 RepID=UPI002E20F501|nr:hypothetical protein [Fictibacillus sp. B-59209]
MTKFSSNPIILFLLCLIFIFLVDLFTQRPGAVSGNGNLGIIPLGISIIMFILFGVALLKQLKKLDLNRRTCVIILTVSLLFLLLSTVLEIRFVTNLVKDLGGPPTVESSEIYRFNWLNQGTNTMFVNAYTFLAFNTMITCFYMAFFLLRKKCL